MAGDCHGSLGTFRNCIDDNFAVAIILDGAVMLLTHPGVCATLKPGPQVER